jgi:hypothetical protein
MTASRRDCLVLISAAVQWAACKPATEERAPGDVQSDNPANDFAAAAAVVWPGVVAGDALKALARLQLGEPSDALGSKWLRDELSMRGVNSFAQLSAAQQNALLAYAAEAPRGSSANRFFVLARDAAVLAATEGYGAVNRLDAQVP